MRFLFAFALILISINAFSGDPFYPASDIPDSLKRNMYAVVRESSSEYKVIPNSGYLLHVHEVITVLNENGESFGAPKVYYDKLRKLNSFKASFYDADGNFVKKAKSSDIEDVSIFDGFSLYADNRARWVPVTANRFPYTVEYEYDIEGKFLGSHSFYLVKDDEVSIQNETWTVTVPQGYELKQLALNISEEPKLEKSADGAVSTTWSFKNYIPKKFEESSPNLNEYTPTLLLEPTTISYENYKGSLASWSDMGHWQGELNKGRDKLPDVTIAKVHQLTDGLPTQEAKVKALYEYLQGKTRYVSIQVGIGGQQPFEASVVDQVGYGDCKALSNYMVALLKAAGIKAYFTVISAEEDHVKVIRDFPFDYFDHVIVCVPSARDTLWLECTNQQNPFDYLGTFTGDRMALLVTENGGKLVHTLTYPEDVNTMNRHATVTINTDGNAKALVHTDYRGLRYEDGHLNFQVNRSYDDQKKWILSNTPIPTFDLNHFSLSASKDKIPSATLQLDLTLNRYASVSGKRVFFAPNLMDKMSYLPNTTYKRTTDYVENFGFVSNDTIEFQLPEGMNPEYIPAPVSLDTPFGHYESSLQNDQGKLTYIRHLVIHKGRYAPSQYDDLVDFYSKINKADNQKVILLGKT